MNLKRSLARLQPATETGTGIDHYNIYRWLVYDKRNICRVFSKEKQLA